MSNLFPNYNEKLANCELKDARFSASLTVVCISDFEQLEDKGISKGRLDSLCYASPTFQINLKWENGRINKDSILVGIVVMHRKKDTYCLEIEDNNYFGMITRCIIVVWENNSNLHVNAVTMSVSLAVYSQLFVEHIHTWYGKLPPPIQAEYNEISR